MDQEIAEILRGDGQWKRDRRHVRMTGKSDTASEYPASLVMAMLSAIKRQMISDGAIRVGELHFAGPVPDEGGYPSELEGKWRVDGTWIDPKLLIAGRKEEMEDRCFRSCRREIVLRQRLQTSQTEWVDKMKGEKCRSRLVSRIKRAKDRDEQLGPEDVFSPMPPSEGLKMLVSAMVTGHDGGNHADGPFEMATWDVSRAHFHVKLAGGSTHIYLKDTSKLASWPDFTGVCMERETQRQFGETRGQKEVWKDGSMKVGTACPAFFCSHDGDLKGLCHGDDFCVVARRKQLQIFGEVLEKRFVVKQTGHTGFSASDAKELKILNRIIKIDVLNDEMTLEADTKLVEGALESMKLTGAKGVDSPRVRRNEEQTAQIENSEKLTSAESTLYRSLVMKVGACRSRQG